MKNVAIIFGGVSQEHDVSIITAKQVYESIDRSKYNILLIYIDRNNVWHYAEKFDIKDFVYKSDRLQVVSLVSGDKTLYRKKGKTFKPYKSIDIALLATHGGMGEDGALQAVLDGSGIVYCSSGRLSSAITMDKIVMKALFTTNNIPTARYISINKKTATAMVDKMIQNTIDYPVIVKPSGLGSSIGISVCKTDKDLDKALNLAYAYDQRVLIEQYIDGAREVNMAVIGDQDTAELSQTEQPIGLQQILTFEDKYISNKKSKGSQKRKMPADISSSEKQQIENISRQLFEIFGLSGVVRIDFLLSKDGTVLVNEINSLPGSLAFYLFKWSFRKHIDKLIAIAEKSSVCNKVIYKSKILDNYIN